MRWEASEVLACILLQQPRILTAPPRVELSKVVLRVLAGDFIAITQSATSAPYWKLNWKFDFLVSRK